MTLPPQPVAARVFSGTGNTLRAATWFVGGRGEVLTLDAPGAGQVPQSAFLLLACPTHGFTAPWEVVRLAWGLPRGQGRPAAVLVTRAGLVVGSWEPPGLAGTAPFLLALVLWLKGWAVRGAASVNMPSNWLSLHPGLGDASVARLLATGRREVEAFAARLQAGRTCWWTVNLAYELTWGLLLAPVSLVYLLAGGRLLGQYFFASTACTSCGQCGLACPLGAIRMRGAPARPEWTLDCTSCMRCMAYCPRRAIEVSWLWGVVSTGVSLLPAAAWVALGGVPRPTGVAWLDLVLLSGAYLAFSVAALPPLSGLVQRALRHRRFNAVMTALSPTHARRWRRYHEPGTRLKALAPGLSKRRDG